jgi:hypothetical protein
MFLTLEVAKVAADNSVKKIVIIFLYVYESNKVEPSGKKGSILKMGSKGVKKYFEGPPISKSQRKYKAMHRALYPINWVRDLDARAMNMMKQTVITMTFCR